MYVHTMDKFNIPGGMRRFLQYVYDSVSAQMLETSGISEVVRGKTYIRSWFLKPIRYMVAVNEGYAGTLSVRAGDELRIYCLSCTDRENVVIGINANNYAMGYQCFTLTSGEYAIAHSNNDFLVVTNIINYSAGRCKLVLVVS